MQTHYSIYPNFQPAIHLTIKYFPVLDNTKLSKIWDIGSNIIALNWELYNYFVSLEKQSDKKKFFESIPKVDYTGHFYPFDAQLTLLAHEATQSE
jgi:hypothetical protein